MDSDMEVWVAGDVWVMYQVKFDWETNARPFEDKDSWKTNTNS